MLFIGVDLGTSAVKLLLMDENGKIKKTVSREYPLYFPHPGWSEQKPEDWYIQSMDGLKELLKDEKKEEVAGISFGGQMHGLVLLDENDEVIRPALLWNDGRTYEENALIKARAVAKEAPDDIVLADDSGLEIDYLNKEPGIYSARYMGEDTSYRIKNTNLIERLTGVPDEKRTAPFVCAIAAAFPDGTIKTTEGVIEGRIGYEERGENGFGYDPIFYVPEFGCTTAELSEEQKNAVSHRGKALEKMREILKESVNAE